MNCPRCDAQIADEHAVCRFCGQDLSVIQYARRVSNGYYNLGLEKAHVRDLSGAVLVLKKSLQFNKENIQARNLLGLVYYELGETVAALSQWLYSCHFQEENNRAKYYLKVVQKNQTTLNTINQTIKKYNLALAAAKSENIDLAIIHLKKVVSLNPKFVRAHQLLALLYMHIKEYSRAVKCLKRARRIDFNNTTTLRYMQEIGDKFNDDNKDREGTVKSYQKQAKKDPLANVQPIGTYKEEKHHWMPMIYGILGAAAGIIVCLVLIRPTINGNRMDSDTNGIAESNQQISVMEAKLSGAEKEKKDLESQVKELKNGQDKAIADSEAKSKKMLDLLKSMKFYQDGEVILAASQVNSYKESDFEDASAKALFKLVSKKLTSADVEKVVHDGVEEFTNGNYDQAEILFSQVIAVEKEHVDALYYLGRVYQQKGKAQKAQKCYESVVRVDGTGTRANDARERLRQLGVTQ